MAFIRQYMSFHAKDHTLLAELLAVPEGEYALRTADKLLAVLAQSVSTYEHVGTKGSEPAGFKPADSRHRVTEMDMLCAMAFLIGHTTLKNLKDAPPSSQKIPQVGYCCCP